MRTETPGFGKALGAAWPYLFIMMVFLCVSELLPAICFAYVMCYLGFLAGLRLTGAPCGR